MRSKHHSSKGMSITSISLVLIFALSAALILLVNLQHVYNAKATGATNTIEDTFNRPNQAGWGATTNFDSVPNVAWGTDANGSLPFCEYCEQHRPIWLSGKYECSRISDGRHDHVREWR